MLPQQLNYLARNKAVIKAFGWAVLAPLRDLAKKNHKEIKVPGPLVEEVVHSPQSDHVAAFQSFLSGEKKAQKAEGNLLPLSLFPQWSFPLCIESIKSYPFQFFRVINAGLRMEIFGTLHVGEKIALEAQVQKVDDDGQRILVEQDLIMGSAANKNKTPAMRVQMFYRFPSLKKSRITKSAKTAAKEYNFRRIHQFDWQLSTAREFALLTGDINPLHLSKSYARLFGFKRPILHGMATMAFVHFTFEQYFGKVKIFDIQFTKPLVLPNSPQLYLEETSGKWVLVSELGATPYAQGEVFFQ